MTTIISFPELQRLLVEQTRKNITVSYIDSKTVKVKYPVSMGFVNKDVSANLTFVEMDGSDLLVGVDAGLGTDKMITTLLSMLNKKIPYGMIEKQSNNRLLIHLNQSYEMRSVLNKINVTDLHVLSTGIELEGTIK